MTRNSLPLRLLYLGLSLDLALFSTGCLHRRRRTANPPVRSPVQRPPAYPGEPIASSDLTGIASWYGYPYQGRSTADGETYNMYDMTAAHRTLPFNTRVRVHDLDNGRSVDVRINDRGPFITGRIIDLSYAAARALGMAGAGIARVELEILDPDVIYGPASTPGVYAVQVGAFRDENNALRLKALIEPRFGPVIIQPYDSPAQGMLYRVRVGSLNSEGTASILANDLKQAGLVTETYVVRLN